MNKITIELTDIQLKALSCICMDPQEYIQNFAGVRSEKAFDDIAKTEVERLLNSGEPIPQTKEEIVMNAVSLKDVPQDP